MTADTINCWYFFSSYFPTCTRIGVRDETRASSRLLCHTKGKTPGSRRNMAMPSPSAGPSRLTEPTLPQERGKSDCCEDFCQSQKRGEVHSWPLPDRHNFTQVTPWSSYSRRRRRSSFPQHHRQGFGSVYIIYRSGSGSSILHFFWIRIRQKPEERGSSSLTSSRSTQVTPWSSYSRRRRRSSFPGCHRQGFGSVHIIYGSESRSGSSISVAEP